MLLDPRQARILVADDDHLLAAVATMALQTNGFNVDEAEDGAVALSLINSHDYDLIILDLEMPNVSGFQVIREIRARAHLQDLPIIVVTSRADPIAIKKSYDLGATSFVVKPIKWNVMVHHIHYAIRTSKMAAEIRVAKNEAEEASQLKGNLLSMISHEFRTPIHAINGFSGLIEKQIGLGADGNNVEVNLLQSNLNEITQATSRLNSILADILLVSSKLNGCENLREDDHRISDLLNDTIQAFDCNQSKHDIKIEAPQSLLDCDFHCDRNMFLKASGHIIENACKFSPDGSTITLSVETSSRGDLIYTTSDQGRGMSDPEIENALKLFCQIDMSATRNANGLGMGLTLSKMICDSHGGRIEINRGEECGTNVSLIFPSRAVDDICGGN